MTGGANLDCLRSDTRAAGAGSAAQVLGALAGLPSLTFIDFSGQRLYGPLPANVTFSNLKFMNLGYNMLQVCTPPSGSTTRQLVWCCLKWLPGVLILTRCYCGQRSRERPL